MDHDRRRRAVARCFALIASRLTPDGREEWFERGDLNPHGCPPASKTGASASSATLATRTSMNKESSERLRLTALGGLMVSREGVEPSTR